MVTTLVSVSVPLTLYKVIEQKRHSTPRSRFCLKLLELGLKQYEEDSK